MSTNIQKYTSNFLILAQVLSSAALCFTNLSLLKAEKAISLDTKYG